MFRGSKTDDSYDDCDPDPPQSLFKRRSEGLKATTVGEDCNLNPHDLRGSERLKETTVGGIAT